MKIIIIGTRGIPNIQGGVESHCEALFPLIKQKEIDITIVRRSHYVIPENKIKEFKGIKLVDIYSPKIKSIEAIFHTVLSVIYAKYKGFKYIHIHAIGPSLVIPFARLIGIKVIMTHHGPDYDRQKWGKLAKLSLKLGEWCAAKYANEIIVISETINKILNEKYKRYNAHLIYNGVNIPNKVKNSLYIESLGLERKKYIIAVGRFVPEKGLHDLIEAYLSSGVKARLVLVGDADHESKYSMKIKRLAINNGIVLTGFIKGDKLNEIFTHAALFVMPSYHEGLPIALLEALSYNLRVLVSDIPANKEVEIEKINYFRVGDVNDLKNKIILSLMSPSNCDYSNVLDVKYNWAVIANQTIEVYKKISNGVHI